MTRPRHISRKVYLTAEEDAEITRRAKATNLSYSEYLRTAGLNLPVRSVLDAKAAKDLALLNGQLAVLANLLNKSPDNESLIKILRELQKQSHEIMGRILR
jgi:hypothetical protein